MSIGIPSANNCSTCPFQQPPTGKSQRQLQEKKEDNAKAPKDIERLEWTAFAQFNNFRANFAILNAGACLQLMDYLEATVGKGQPENGRFGTLGLKMLANLDVNDPRWEQTKIHVPRSLRPMVKKAAYQADHSPNMVKLITGDDLIFEPGDIAKWLNQNPPIANIADVMSATTARRYQQFRGAVDVLSSEKAISIMDYLEKFHGGEEKIPDYEHFGRYAIKLLASLDTWSPEWKAVGLNNPYDTTLLIDAATQVLDPMNAEWLFQLHNGDGILGKNEMANWLWTNGILRLKS